MSRDFASCRGDEAQSTCTVVSLPLAATLQHKDLYMTIDKATDNIYLREGVPFAFVFRQGDKRFNQTSVDLL